MSKLLKSILADYTYYLLTGLEEGFPVCCAIQFSEEVLLGLHPPEERAKKFKITLKKARFNGFVPCNKCMRKRIKSGWYE